MGINGSTTQKAKWVLNKIGRGLRLYYTNGSLKACHLLFLHTLRRLFKKDVPDLITIGVTYRCQCRCVHCSTNVPNREPSSELDTGQVKSIIDQARKLGIVRVTFFGGEPLLRSDIVELVRYAHNAGMLTRINTNGWRLDRELVSSLKAAGLSLCDVSIDDPDPETHDRLRGLPGLYRKVIAGIKVLGDFNIPCQIVTYAAKKNISVGLERIIDIGRQLHVFGVSIVFPMATGCWHKAAHVLLTEPEKQKVRALGDSAFTHVELPTPGSKCNVLRRTSLYVSPEGDVTPCPFVPYVMGNIKREKLADIWCRFASITMPAVAGDCVMNDSSFREVLKSAIENCRHL